MRGANRLAIEALPLFPTGGAEVWWPIWTDALELDTVASLLAAGKEPERPGVAQVYKSERFTEGKYRNFSPAKAML
jgi:hypothetical protein